MKIIDILTADRVRLDVRARDKPQLLAEIGRSFGHLPPGITPAAIQAALLAREHLGSTGFGGAFALPHAPIDHLATFLGLFMRLARPIDFDAIDDKPVALVFVLLIPAEMVTPHVGALAAVSRRFRDKALVDNLLQAKTAVEAYHLLTND